MTAALRPRRKSAGEQRSDVTFGFRLLHFCTLKGRCAGVSKDVKKFYCALTYDERQDEAVQDKLRSAHSDWSFLKGKHMVHFN